MVTSVAIRKCIKMSMYRETLLTSMAMFGGKKGTLVKLLTDTLVTSKHMHMSLLKILVVLTTW